MITGPLRTVLAGCLCAMLFGVSTAQAASGRITFSGAIVEPTCGMNAQSAATLMADASAQGVSHPVTCGGSNAVAGTADAQAYTVTVARLSDAEPDHVLRYFSDYVRASQANAPNPALVTQTYQ